MCTVRKVSKGCLKFTHTHTNGKVTELHELRIKADTVHIGYRLGIGMEWRAADTTYLLSCKDTHTRFSSETRSN